MHLTKPTLLLLALTISAGYVAATPQPGLLEGLWDELGKTGQTIVSGLAEATKNGSEIAVDLTSSLKNSTSKFIEQTAQFADQIASALHAAVDTALRDFANGVQAQIKTVKAAIARIPSVLKRQALRDALAALQNINASAGDLQTALRNITDQLDYQKARYGAEIQLTWNNWAAAQLERVDQETNGVGTEEAQEILDELENRYSGYLHSCLEEQQVRLATYEQEVHKTVSRIQKSTNALIGQVESCQRILFGPISCRNAIKKALSALQSTPRDLLNLKLQGLRLLAAGLDEAGCVGQTLADHALERPSVERLLDAIIERYKEELNTTESSEEGSGSDEESSSVSDSSSEEESSTEPDWSSEESSTDWGSGEESSTDWGSEEESSTDWGSDEESSTDWGSGEESSTDWGSEEESSTDWSSGEESSTDWSSGEESSSDWSS